jgi:2-hydroxychromene-2-carboxylate isomerase
MTPIEPGRTLPAKSLELFFDYTCPFAYVGSTQARALAERMGVPLTYKPILLGGVFRAKGTPQNLSEVLGPAKTAHNEADMQRWAAHFGVPLHKPAAHPLRSVEALRATLATGIDPAVIDGFYRAYWVEGRPVSSPEVVRDVVAAAGHDPERVAREMATDAIKADLRRRTDEAIERGVFGVPTWIVDGSHLYWGQDRMHFVEGVRREPQTPAIAPPAPPVRPAPTLDFYWDFSSPFAYLAATQIAALAARTGATLTWHGILLGGLFRSIGTPDVPLATFPAAKQRHVMHDLDRWAAYWGVPFKFPSRFPMSTVRAMRVHLALPEERRAAYRDAVFRAYWADDRDISDAATLASCLGDEAIAREVLEKSASDAVKAELRAETDRAAARGVFGVPTVVVQDRDIYWGQDRLGLVEAALAC